MGSFGKKGLLIHLLSDTSTASGADTQKQKITAEYTESADRNRETSPAHIGNSRLQMGSFGKKDLSFACCPTFPVTPEKIETSDRLG
jgi:hypothetical protein